MSITRTFLDWSRPALPAVAAWLADKYGVESPDELNLSTVVLIVPGGRAGRRLTELLAETAADRRLVYHPPDVRTVGTFPELLYEPKRPFANPMVQQLAWREALRQIEPDSCRRLIPDLPAKDDFASWMSLAQLLARQHRELAADGLDFQDVVQLGRNVAGFNEGDRWGVLSELQARYLAILDGLELWDLQTARRFAIQHRECTIDRDLVLVATTDLNRAQRQMLDQVADRVTALISAPSEMTDRFDRHGCLEPASWTDVAVPLSDDQICVAMSPSDQAETVADALAGLGGRYRSDQVVIGAPDERLIPQLTRRLAESGVTTRWVVGKSVAETGPYCLLQAVSDLVLRDRYADFARLIRHPDVETWIRRHGVHCDWLTRSDKYYREHLPTTFGQWLSEDAYFEPVRQIAERLHTTMQPLRAGLLPLGQWAERISQLLSTFYGSLTLDPAIMWHRYTLSALQAIQSTLQEFVELPESLMPRLSATEAMEQLLRRVGSETVPAPSAEDAVEILGWLELPLDTAPALVVTSFNEGYVPTSVTSDLFLPNALRKQLGLVDNSRRLARDAYAVSCLAASREALTMVCGRRSPDGDPLIPSRLALATDARSMAQRARKFFGPSDNSDATRESGSGEPAESRSSQIVVPRPVPLDQPITSIGVTAFRSYLACPYRFYLRHVLHLERLDDDDTELGPAEFGNLLHYVLEQFGRSDVRRARRAEEIQEYLRDQLDRFAEARYGHQRHPAVEVQIVQAAARLDAFAEWQARRAADGWEIVHAEFDVKDARPQLAIDTTRTVELRGRVDRIDRRGDSWAILDYKTSDTARKPQETHLRNGQWIDLQLPLYRHLVTSLGIPDGPELGYIVLPRDTTKTGEFMAGWTDKQLAEADNTARRVALAILNEEFWPPALPAPQILTDYRVICQEDAFRPNWEGGKDPEASR